MTLPDTITEIGRNAFYHCDNLTTLNLPDGITTIGDNAFGKCSSLTSLTIPASVTSGIESALGLSASDGYPHASDVTFANGSPYQIVDGILYQNTVLLKLIDRTRTEVTVKDGTTKIGDLAFGFRFETSGPVISSITLPDTVTEIGEDAFAYTDITSIDLSHVTSIGESAFSHTDLSSVNLTNVDELGESVFSYCKELKSFVWPSSMTTIPKSTFSNAGLTSFVIPDGVTSVGDNAFLKVEGLTMLSVPESVESIGSKAFMRAFADDESAYLIMQKTTPPTLGTNVVGNTKPENLKVFYPETAEAAYKGTILVGESEDNGYALSLTPSTTMALASTDAGNNTLTLSGITVPEGMTLDVTSSDEAVATAAFDDGKLTFTGMGEGTATITATLSVNGYTVLTDTCVVTVTDTASS